MSLHQKWCLMCRAELVEDGPMGWVHDGGDRYGADGHTVTPVDQQVLELVHGLGVS